MWLGWKQEMHEDIRRRIFLRRCSWKMEMKMEERNLDK
jgi:hypothetical protein